tara:strand:- start:6290 stop:8338 length:2049 start_codon:yes stop_codon:yes gene_type:complete
MNKTFIIGIIVICFVLSFVSANEEVVEESTELITLQVGDITVTGEDVQLGSADTIKFVHEESHENPIEITTFDEEGEEIKVIIQKIEGDVDSEGYIRGSSFFGVANISYEKGEYYEFYNLNYQSGDPIEFSFDLIYNELEIKSGEFEYGGKLISSGEPMLIIGNRVYPEGSVIVDGYGTFDGDLVIEENGILLSPRQGEEAEFNDKDNEGTLTLSKGDIFIGGDGFDPGNYEGAFYYYENYDEFQLTSVEGTSVQYKASSANTILDTRTDEDLFQITMDGEGSLYAQNREETGKTPFVKVMGEDFELENGYYNLDESGIINIDERYGQASNISNLGSLLGQNSVPMYIEGDNQGFTFASTNSMKVSDSEGETIATYYDLGMPINDDFNDNYVRSMDDLRIEWPDIAFAEAISYESKEPSPATVQALHHWLSEEDNLAAELIYVTPYPNQDMALEFEGYKTIKFSDTLYNLDPYDTDYSRLTSEGELYEFAKDREFYGHPMRTLEHENGHLIVNALNDESDGALMTEYNRIISEAVDDMLEDPRMEGIIDVALDKGIIRNIEEARNLNTNEFYKDLMILSDPESLEAAAELERMTEHYGLPSMYSLYNYGTGRNPSYDELSTTYLEEPIEQKTERVHSDNPYVSSRYEELTQLAYDTGQITSDECLQIMGETCRMGVIWSIAE